jgi:hypothetical protein
MAHGTESNALVHTYDGKYSPQPVLVGLPPLGSDFPILPVQPDGIQVGPDLFAIPYHKHLSNVGAFFSP